MTTRRSLVLPARGMLLVNTDLHGNLADFEQLETIFEAAIARGEDAHWAILGDLVHGPSGEAAQAEPRLYGYPDESRALVERVIAARTRHPGRVHFVLGNHDHGHVGGKQTAKFHEDEVEFLEGQQSAAERAAMHALFEEALLVIAAPCGALLAHGSPGDELTSLALLDGGLTQDEDPARWRALQSTLWSYGQPREVTEALLSRIGVELGLPLRFVIHGHDRDEEGVIIEGENQLQPVLFGALREHKRYLWLELASHYCSPRELRDGLELRRLYPR